MKPTNQIRVLHSFSSLGMGGIEIWLMNILRLQPEELKFDFILEVLGGEYEEEARNYGCNIHHAPPIRQLGKKLHFLEEVLGADRYEVFHVHGEEFMGDALKIAAKAGVPVRIAHSHNTVLARGKKSLEMKIRSLRFQTLDRFFLLNYATDIVACSSEAGRFLMGRHWDNDPRCKTIYCGVSLNHFRQALAGITRARFRTACGIPGDAIVIGHAGSFGPSNVKNHHFLVKIFEELTKRDERYYLYMAGDGPLRNSIEQTVCARSLKDRVLMPGLSADVPSLMVHGFDVHLLPSLHEGLPIVGLEATAAGLYTVCSNTITKDFTDYFASRVKTVALDAEPSYWADRVEEAVAKRIPANEGIALIEQSPFHIKSSTQSLIDTYRNSYQTNTVFKSKSQINAFR
jgi:glycosyltransferase involved in cell wall biosynthesis